MKLGILVHHVHGYKTLGLSYGLSKWNKRGKHIELAQGSFRNGR